LVNLIPSIALAIIELPVDVFVIFNAFAVISAADIFDATKLPSTVVSPERLILSAESVMLEPCALAYANILAAIVLLTSSFTTLYTAARVTFDSSSPTLDSI